MRRRAREELESDAIVGRSRMPTSGKLLYLKATVRELLRWETDYTYSRWVSYALDVKNRSPETRQQLTQQVEVVPSTTSNSFQVAASVF